MGKIKVFFINKKSVQVKFFLNITFFRKNIPFIHFVSKLLNIYQKYAEKKKKNKL